MISNIDEVSWEVPDGVDRITRGAIWCSSGWLLLRSFQGGRCESGAKIIYRRGALSLFVVPTEDQFLPSDGPPPAANFAA